MFVICGTNAMSCNFMLFLLTVGPFFIIFWRKNSYVELRKKILSSVKWSDTIGINIWYGLVNVFDSVFFFLRMCYMPHIVFSTDRIDDLDIRVKQFFMNCRKAKPEWKEQQYKQIRDVRSTYKTINLAIIMQIE